jgi:hypothetical protein
MSSAMGNTPTLVSDSWDASSDDGERGAMVLSTGDVIGIVVPRAFAPEM